MVNGFFLQEKKTKKVKIKMTICKKCGHEIVYSETGVCCAELGCECTQDSGSKD